MAAVIDLHTGSHLPEVPHRRPALTLVQGGRADLTAADPSGTLVVSRRTYLVRRTVVLLAAALVVVLAAQLLGSVAGTAADALDRPPAASGRVHVVESGDTAWSLAARLAPGLDRRTAVDDLLALNGEGPLRVGQELRLPASFD